MTNSESFDQNNPNSNAGITASELAVIGALISTLGDVISTIAAVLALEEERRDQQDDINNNNNYVNMQKQIDYLTTEHEKLKKQVNNQNPHWRS